jgi:cysteinyl-tRNA synthetase
MSKSLGNFYTLRDLEEKNHKPEAIRYLLLATHYRQKLNFTLKSLEAAQNSVDRLQDFYRNLTHIKATKNHPKVKPLIEKAKAEFEKKLDDDLNISEALAVIFDFMRDINKLELSKQNAEDIITVIKQFNTVIGVIQTEQDDLEPAFQELIDQREEARKNKNFEESDKIRNELKKKGILLDDTSEGVIWKRT